MGYVGNGSPRKLRWGALAVYVACSRATDPAGVRGSDRPTAREPSALNEFDARPPSFLPARDAAGAPTASSERPTPPALVPPPPLPPPASSSRRLDGGARACLVIRSPISLPARGAVALDVRNDAILAVQDDDGRPRVTNFSSAGNPLAASTGPELGDPPSPALAVPCAIAGDVFFCPDRTGAVHRASAKDGSDRVVASSRPGSRVSAGELAEGHLALAYLASRKTSEGWVSEAWLGLDEAAPVRASVDSSGATALALEPRGPVLRLLTVDARAALTAMHVRPVSLAGGALSLGEDAVVFVAGPGDRRTAAALVSAPGAQGWALLPIAKDMGDFGLAAVRIDAPARVDEPVVWSMYPNGLDPAPVSAALSRGALWVARVRPEAADPTSPHRLELGRLMPSGEFVSRDFVSTSGPPSDVALAADGHDTLWLAWTDPVTSWVERLDCR